MFIFLNFSYAPWCPACRNIKPVWDKFAIQAGNLNVRVAEVDVTKNAGLSLVLRAYLYAFGLPFTGPTLPFISLESLTNLYIFESD